MPLLISRTLSTLWAVRECVKQRDHFLPNSHRTAWTTCKRLPSLPFLSQIHRSSLPQRRLSSFRSRACRHQSAEDDRQESDGTATGELLSHHWTGGKAAQKFGGSNWNWNLSFRNANASQLWLAERAKSRECGPHCSLTVTQPVTL